MWSRQAALNLWREGMSTSSNNQTENRGELIPPFFFKMKAILIFFCRGKTSTCRVSKPLTTIGRSPQNDVLLTVASVSRKHAYIHFNQEEGKHLICDGCPVTGKASSHGVFVNNWRISQDQGFILSDNDIVRLGREVSFRYSIINPKRVEADGTEV